MSPLERRAAARARLHAAATGVWPSLDALRALVGITDRAALEQGVAGLVRAGLAELRRDPLPVGAGVARLALTRAGLSALADAEAAAGVAMPIISQYHLWGLTRE